MRTERARLLARFPIGATVKLNDFGARQFPKYKERKGKVVAHARNGSPKVLFEHRTTDDVWHETLLRVVSRGND